MKTFLPCISRNSIDNKELHTWNVFDPSWSTSRNEKDFDSKNNNNNSNNNNRDGNGRTNNKHDFNPFLKLLDEKKKAGGRKVLLSHKENIFNKKLEMSTTMKYRNELSFSNNNQNQSYSNIKSIEWDNKFESKKENQSTNSSKNSDKEQQPLQTQSKGVFNSSNKNNVLMIKQDRTPWRILKRWCDNDQKEKLIHRNSQSDDADVKSKTNLNKRKRHSLSMVSSREEDKKCFIKSYHVISQPGRTEDDTVKTNQDSYLIETRIFNFVGFNIFGVFDGHGVNGHLVSQFVSEYISSSILNNQTLRSSKTWDEIYEKWRDKNYLIINNIFTSAEEELKHVDFDCSLSGTTSVIVFQIGKIIICANTGDSRAIVVNNSIGSNRPFSLSKDHKPELPSERNRIEKMGGCVERYSEHGTTEGPFRVWLRNKSFPGLAMSRSIGDWIASSIGVIPTPEVIEYIIDDHTKYIIIASDGIWEFLNDNMVMNLSHLYYEKNDPEKLCEVLLSRSTKWWKKKGNSIDDITVLALFV